MLLESCKVVPLWSKSINQEGYQNIAARTPHISVSIVFVDVSMAQTVQNHLLTVWVEYFSSQLLKNYRQSRWLSCIRRLTVSALQRTLSCAPDEQLSESLSLNHYAAATDVNESSNGSDPGPETEYATDVELISALHICYTFLRYLTQRQLQLVCGKFELSKCGTKEILTRSILQRLNAILDGAVRDRKDQGPDAGSDF
jgi:hypothetical protein